RHQPQEQQVVEGVGPETVAHAGEPGTGARAQQVGKGRARREEQQRGAEGRGENGGAGTEPLAEHAAPGKGENGGPGQRERDDTGVDQQVGGEDEEEMVGDLPIKPVAIGPQSLQREVALQAEGKEQGRSKSDGQNRQPASNATLFNAFGY